MHEISLVRTILSNLEAEFTPEDLACLKSIKLKVGLLSNVEPILMQNAFDAVTSAEGRFVGVELNIELVPIIIHCKNCSSASHIQHYKFICANCGKPCNNLISGTELHIHQLQFEE